MDYLRILWDDPDDPEGNVRHIGEHGLTIDEVEDVLADPASEGLSKVDRPASRMGIYSGGSILDRRL